MSTFMLSSTLTVAMSPNPAAACKGVNPEPDKLLTGQPRMNSASTTHALRADTAASTRSCCVKVAPTVAAIVVELLSLSKEVTQRDD
jgi:hypothetical protein